MSIPSFMYTLAVVIIATLFLPFSLAQQKPVNPTRKVYELELENTRFAVLDRDLNEPKEYQKLTFPGKFPSVLEATATKKMKMQFNLKNKADGKNVLVHQAFIVFTHQQSEREIIYIAEPDNTTARTYTFDLDMKMAAKEFGGINGRYIASLILGDALISKPILWEFADIQLKDLPQAMPSQTVPKSRNVIWTPLPEIQHQFRVDEPRPPTIVSDVFSMLCVAPLLLLFILWGRIGLNFGRLSVSLCALGFHLGLAGVFGLYACYWLRLNMFQTLKWLVAIGVPTFVCGNRLLRSIATGSSPKKQKPE